jgi:hypothetical protein
MFGRFLGGRNGGNDRFKPRMPEVDLVPEIETRFEQARAAAAGEVELPPAQRGRNVVVVTPGRMLMFLPCPPAGSMPAAQVASIEKMVPSAVKRKIAAIAYTELEALQADAAKTIPFLGFLYGFAYVGHAVWIFEGHESALAAGCHEADVLLVDGGMVTFLPSNWQSVAGAAMRRPEIYVHDRASYALRPAARS